MFGPQVSADMGELVAAGGINSFKFFMAYKVKTQQRRVRQIKEAEPSCCAHAFSCGRSHGSIASCCTSPHVPCAVAIASMQGARFGGPH